MADLPLDQILVGDCIDIMTQLPEKSVDIIFADPPYNLQLQQDLWRPNMTKVDAVDDAWDRFEDLAAYDRFTEDWLMAARRLLKDEGTLWVIGSYHNIYRVGKIMMDLGFWILNDIVWVKTNPMPNFKGKRFTNAHETMLWAQKEKGHPYTFHYQALKAMNDDLQMRSDWHIPLCPRSERLMLDGQKVHSTQKPEALLYRVIASSTNPQDVILDPFFGSGTSGAVAKKLHRHWIGIERDPLYIQAAQRRLDSIQVGVFDASVYNGTVKAKRIPFGALLEYGLLTAGQTLYFGKTGSIEATIQADGRLKHGELVGSIHQVGKALLNAPSCNGWDHWYYTNEAGKRLVIDVLREQVRVLLEETELQR